VRVGGGAFGGSGPRWKDRGWARGKGLGGVAVSMGEGFWCWEKMCGREEGGGKARKAS
jgi:hypothetical protein